MAQQRAGSGGGAEQGVNHSAIQVVHPLLVAPLAIRGLEWVSGGLVGLIVVLLLVGVVSRYAFAYPVVWLDEVVSMAFIWLTMLGTAVAMARHEHLRLSLVVDRLPPRPRAVVQAVALAAVVAALVVLLVPAWEYMLEEWTISTPALGMPNALRVAAIPAGLLAMLGVACWTAWRTLSPALCAMGVLVVLTAAGAMVLAGPVWQDLADVNILVFLVGLVALCLVLGVPIAFCFALGTVAYLACATDVPLLIVIGRMDEGMSAIILVSVPIFVLLGCILDRTGMGRAIVDFLASLIGHVKAGMSYVLLGSLFIVSGISGSKVSDMATVAPALFPEMKRRGHSPREMVALLATGAAMADTVPPSIVLIVLGSVAGVSIAGLFQSGFAVAMVLLAVLLVLARWKARHEQAESGLAPRARLSRVGWTLLIAAPALLLPFLIRGAVGGGVATATEVSTLAVVYALLVGQVLYGGVPLRALGAMLVETAALSGSILLILGAASAMAWAITQSGVVQQLSQLLTTLPGGPVAFLLVTVLVFLLLGCLLEGLPAVLLLGPIMFPIARKLGIHDIHYAMVVVTAMNVGLMMPPIGVGFYVACRIGEASPDEVMGAIWPYLLALLGGVLVIALFPWLSTWML